MLFQVNYKYVTDKLKLRAAALVVEADDTKQARAKATKEIKSDVDHFEITSIQNFGKAE